jgi:hypothetical protein
MPRGRGTSGRGYFAAAQLRAALWAGPLASGSEGSATAIEGSTPGSREAGSCIALVRPSDTGLVVSPITLFPLWEHAAAVGSRSLRRCYRCESESGGKRLVFSNSARCLSGNRMTSSTVTRASLLAPTPGLSALRPAARPTIPSTNLRSRYAAFFGNRSSLSSGRICSIGTPPALDR